MARNFNTTNKTKPIKNRAATRMLWQGSAYPEFGGIGPKMIRDTNFVEMIHYGLIDNENNSIIPNEDFIVETQSGRVFDFVADSYSLMRLNWTTAGQKNLVSLEGSAFGNLSMVDSYKNPKVKYGEYLGNILRYYNNTHIPNFIGITNISSYKHYVKNFFDFIFKGSPDVPITMTRWNTSRFSSVLNSGLAFSYSDIRYDADQEKIDKIIDHPSNEYFQNLCLNMGFSILHNTPNVLLYDVASPATEGIRFSYGLINLSSIFNNRYIKTYTIDNNILYNIINRYYNKYALKHPLVKVTKVKCKRTVSTYFELSTVPNSRRPYSDLEELNVYIKLRNHEENRPFSKEKLQDIYRQAKFFMKTVDKARAMSYINNEFKDQVWNKDYGYHDLRKKLRGKTTTQGQREQVGAVRSRQTTPYTGGSSGGSSY